MRLFARSACRRFVLFVALIGALAVVVTAAPAIAAMWIGGQIIPIYLTASSTNLSANTTFSVTVTVDQVVPGGDYVQLGCTDSSVSSPSGSWPYRIYFPADGPTSQTITLTTTSTAPDSSTTLFGCRDGVDPTITSNWTVTLALVTPVETARMEQTAVAGFRPVSFKRQSLSSDE